MLESTERFVLQESTDPNIHCIQDTETKMIYTLHTKHSNTPKEIIDALNNKFAQDNRDGNIEYLGGIGNTEEVKKTINEILSSRKGQKKQEGNGTKKKQGHLKVEKKKEGRLPRGDNRR